MTVATDHDATRTLLTADQLDQRTRARVAVTIAKSSGRLVPEPCVRCGAGNTDGHHEDYSKPLDVVWLCRRCHVARHKEIGNWGTPASPRTAEIASLVAGGEPTAAIAADRARAVEAAEDTAFIRGRDAVRAHPDGWGLIARPTPDEARRLVTDHRVTVDALAAHCVKEYPKAAETFRLGKLRDDSEAALLRALGVEP